MDSRLWTKKFQNIQPHLSKIFTLTDQMLVSGSHFVIGILLARSLGIEMYGVFALAWMLVLFASSMQQSFLLIPMMTFAPQKTKEAQQVYFKDLWYLQILVALFAYLVSVITIQLANIFAPNWQFNLVGQQLAVAVVLFITHDFFRKKFYTQNLPHQSFLLDIIVYGIQIGGLMYLFFFGKMTLKTCFWCINLGYGTGILASLLYSFLKERNKKQKIHSPFLIPNTSNLKPHPSLLETIRKHFKFSSWLVGRSLLQWFSGNYFIVMAGVIFGTVGVGAVRIAQNVIGVLNVLFLALENYVPVRAAAIFSANGKTSLFNYLKTVTIKGGFLTVLVVLAVIFSAKWMIWGLYGDGFEASVPLLQGLAVLYLFVFLAIPLRLALRTLEKTHHIFIAYVIVTVFSAVAARPFLETFGINGVILGLVIAQIIMILWFFIGINYLQNRQAFSH